MSERTKVIETETTGEYGEQVIAHGKDGNGVYRPLLIDTSGKVMLTV